MWFPTGQELGVDADDVPRPRLGEQVDRLATATAEVDDEAVSGEHGRQLLGEQLAALGAPPPALGNPVLPGAAALGVLSRRGHLGCLHGFGSLGGRAGNLGAIFAISRKGPDGPDGPPAGWPTLTAL